MLRRTGAPEIMTAISPEKYTLSALKHEYGKVLGVVVDTPEIHIQFSPLTMALAGIVGVSMFLQFAVLLFQNESRDGNGGQQPE